MVTATEFGKMQDGTVIKQYHLTNAAGMEACIINYGAIMTNLFVPDAEGKKRDVVLGFDELEGYYGNGGFIGATVGPLANRTAKAQFEMDGVICQLDVNDNDNNLHSHMEKGLHKRVWNAKELADANAVEFTISMPDGDIGFPGNKDFKVTFTLTEDNEIKIDYAATSDKNTIINMTNHSYFNLSGHASGCAEHTCLQIKANEYVPVVAGAIPTGELPSVENTPMDFRQFHTIGERIRDDFEQLEVVGGYDHNYAIAKDNAGMEKVTTAIDDNSKIQMDVYTDLPGIQLYAGNFIGKVKGKEGVTYDNRVAFCLETQYFPNSANEPNFERPVFGPEKPYKTTTIYKFSTI